MNIFLIIKQAKVISNYLSKLFGNFSLAFTQIGYHLISRENYLFYKDESSSHCRSENKV